jgi:hypothetical protein
MKMQTKCPLCDGTQFKRLGTTASGHQKYCCSTCKNIVIDGIDSSYCSTEINFLKFKRKNSTQSSNRLSSLKHLNTRGNQKISTTDNAEKSLNWMILSRIFVFTSSFVNDVSDYNEETNSSSLSDKNSRFVDSIKFKIFYGLGIISLFTAISFGLSYCINGNLGERYFPMFYAQAEAFLQGRINIIGDSKLDLIPFDNKFYLAIPPLNAFLILPFVYFFKEGFTETWFANILYSLLIIIQFIFVEKFAANKSFWQRSLLFTFLALGTMILPCAVISTSWFNALLGSCFFLSLSWLTLYNAKNPRQDILAVTFLCIASIGRFHLALLIPIFILKAWRRRHWRNFNTLVSLCVLCIPAILFVMFVLWWNWVRFGNLFSLKYEDLVYADFFSKNIQKYGFRNLVYILPNIYHGILAFPKLIPQFPFFKIDDMGNGILAISPLFIYILFDNRKRNSLNRFAWLCMAVVAIPIFTHCSTGWRQFGYRYFLDFLPFASFLLLQSKIDPIRPLPIFCIALSLWFNIFGPILFLNPGKFGQ